MPTPKIISWNTGCAYTEKGQRIGAIAICGGVFMSDQDRGISYFLPECKLDREAIMRRYNYNDRCEYGIPSDASEADRALMRNRWELIAELNAASKEAK